MKKGILTIAVMLVAIPLFAHEGGHGADQALPVTNRWELADGSLVEGTYLYGDDTRIVLERSDGSSIRVSLSDLSARDRRLAQFRNRRAARLNGSPAAPVQSLPGGSDLAWIVFALAAGILGQWAVARFDMFRTPREGFRTATLRLAVFAAGLMLVMACRKGMVTTPPSNAGVTIPRTRVGFLDSAFAPYRTAVTTRSDNTWYYIESNGMPSHNMMVGITSWQQQVPIPQAYTGSNSWSVPLQPEYAVTPLSTRSNFMKGAVAIAVNGIPIFNALNNRGEDSYALGELDQWGGHCGRADDYHYHAAPMHLSGANAALPIAFALDGFAVYGAKEPDGAPMAGLDTCHGHGLGNAVYHYHGTSTYPYLIGAMRGKVSLDPATPAPENQILPQAFAKPARPATTPLRGAVITEFKSTGTNAYSLTYRIGTRNGYVHYSWDAAGRYTYTLVDTSGASSTATYQR